jgi:hypothetical protein
MITIFELDIVTGELSEAILNEELVSTIEFDRSASMIAVQEEERKN